MIQTVQRRESAWQSEARQKPKKQQQTFWMIRMRYYPPHSPTDKFSQ
jgi:secreted Zn-dependent insulinase-like peptidase